MKRSQGGDRTFETVRARYEAWEENRPPAPAAGSDWSPHLPEPGFSMEKIVFTAIGVGTGVILLVLAALSFWTASQWAGFDREPATIGYMVVGLFLVVAGLGGILATLNHMFRVLDPSRREAHSHL